MTGFPNRLKAIRTARRITQKTMAEFLGITEQVYQKYEYGKREPDHETIIKLAEFLEITVDYLLEQDIQTYNIRSVSRW